MPVHVTFTPSEEAAARIGVVVEGFDAGASPRDFTRGPAARTPIRSTTNATAATLTAATRFETVLIGSRPT